jgi:SEC-C motif-containing protein
MTDFNACPCGSSKQFFACCEPFILEKELANSAEQLMRSRYSAYVVGAIDYLVDTTHFSTRANYKRKDIENWSKSTKWLGLEILHATESTVEFKAFFEGENNTKETHYEKSNFAFENGKWYYVDGVFY